METGTLVDIDTGASLVTTCYRTTTPWERMRGLLGRPPLTGSEGLLIDPCGSIHTLLMKYPIDVVYLTRSFVVTKVVPGIVPWRLSMGFGAAMTLELAAGQAAFRDLYVGRALAWRTTPEL